MAAKRQPKKDQRENESFRIAFFCVRALYFFLKKKPKNPFKIKIQSLLQIALVSFSHFLKKMWCKRAPKRKRAERNSNDESSCVQKQMNQRDWLEQYHPKLCSNCVYPNYIKSCAQLLNASVMSVGLNNVNTILKMHLPQTISELILNFCICPFSKITPKTVRSKKTSACIYTLSCDGWFCHKRIHRQANTVDNCVECLQKADSGHIVLLDSEKDKCLGPFYIWSYGGKLPALSFVEQQPPNLNVISFFFAFVKDFLYL